MNLVGLSGSLRKDSIHTVLLHEAASYVQGRATMTIAPIDLPLYNEDIDDTVDAAHVTPDSVTRFKRGIEEADGLIIASPEYNHSVSGALKNAIDWASRPAFDSPLKGKPVAILSASPGPVGGARGQAHLRVILASTLSHVFPAIEFVLGNARETMSAQNRLDDDNAHRRLKRFVSQFTEYVERTTRKEKGS